jgi:hypothetical protein
MTLVEEQHEELAKKFCGATCVKSPDGSYLVTVPNFVLPEGWTPNTTTVRFIAPVGFPASRPDCFWTDHNLRLEGGRNPQNTGQNPLPHGPNPLLWFSWHVEKWSPNSDSLLSYFRVIENRFHELR